MLIPKEVLRISIFKGERANRGERGKKKKEDGLAMRQVGCIPVRLCLALSESTCYSGKGSRGNVNPAFIPHSVNLHLI